MKNRYYVLTCIMVAVALYGCKENERQLYSEKPAVYFTSFSEQDSLIHSLVAVESREDTVHLAVSLLGHAMPTAQKFKISVDPKYSTAIEGVHYEKLKEEYNVDPNKFRATVPLILIKGDPQLNTGFLKLGLRLTATNDLGVGYPNKLYAKVWFTNELVKPIYWDSFLKIYYGEYSKVKHQKCLDIQGFDFPATMAEIPSSMFGTLMSYGRLVCKYFTDNVVHDENDNRILPWPAF